MATIIYNGVSYPVDHAVKGADYVHGYDANNVCVFSVEGVTNFDNISYDGEYLAPEACTMESCNIVRTTNGVVAGGLKTLAEDITVAQTRNIYAGTEDMEVGVTPLATGDIYVVYE